MSGHATQSTQPTKGAHPIRWQAAARTLAAASLMLLGCKANAQRDRGSASASRLDTLPACEWCGAAEAPAGLTSTMRLAAGEPGARLTVTGTVYFADRTTPAPNVLIYAYHTDATGTYPRPHEQRGNGRRHGALRGWLRTDASGRYRIETIRPGPYPGRPDPAHIHMTVMPPVGEEYYIDSIEFDDDPRLTASERKRREGRGGPGIVVLRDSAGALRATRDIILRENGSATKTGASVERHGQSVAVLASATVTSSQTLVPVDVSQSLLRWKGTKFRGRGSHEGIVRLASGTLRRCGATVCGGTFEIDMTTIEVTDIPVTDPVPRDRLLEHLEGDDFFATAQHPRARFVMSSVAAQPSPSGSTVARYMVRGALTLRAMTQSVDFPATITRCGTATCVDASVMIDRRRWGITYRYDPVRNLIVDDSIAIGMHIVVPNSPEPDVAVSRIASLGAAARIARARAH